MRHEIIILYYYIYFVSCKRDLFWLKQNIKWFFYSPVKNDHENPFFDDFVESNVRLQDNIHIIVLHSTSCPDTKWRRLRPAGFLFGGYSQFPPITRYKFIGTIIIIIIRTDRAVFVVVILSCGGQTCSSLYTEATRNRFCWEDDRRVPVKRQRVAQRRPTDNRF